jgi:glycerophosphoryl diester phosphodiesterase
MLKFIPFAFILYLCLLSIACKTTNNVNMEKKIIDYQGHRGCRGLWPENTLVAFEKALTFPKITTLELDIVMTKDGQIIISHEPWLNPEICKGPKGEINYTEHLFDLYTMNYTEIKKCDCGSLKHPRFQSQTKVVAYKPLLSDLFVLVKKKLHRKIMYNIEIKSNPEWDDKYTPKPEVIATALLQLINKYKMDKYVTIQSFDTRSLEVVKKLNPTMKLAYLVETNDSVIDNLKKITFKPDIYSPYYGLISTDDIQYLHNQSIKVIPWTVNTAELIERMVSLGVDGIITDYPNLIK